MSGARNRSVRRLVILIAGAAGVAILLVGFGPFFRSTRDFVAWESEPRVRYEPGAESAAMTVARALPEAIATVERAQYRPFAKPVHVFVCASTQSFERFGYGVAAAGGFVLNGRLFISPKPQNTAERLPRLLAHELSHLHFEQRLGMWRWMRHVPEWFKEGVAVRVARGGGAETVSEAQARDAIVAGRVFRPEIKGSLFPRSGSRDGLEPHLFYRESAMFVAYLAESNATAFEQLLEAIHARTDFAPAIRSVYHQDVGQLMTSFRREIVAERSR